MSYSTKQVSQSVTCKGTATFNATCTAIHVMLFPPIIIWRLIFSYQKQQACTCSRVRGRILCLYTSYLCCRCCVFGYFTVRAPGFLQKINEASKLMHNLFMCYFLMHTHLSNYLLKSEEDPGHRLESYCTITVRPHFVPLALLLGYVYVYVYV